MGDPPLQRRCDVSTSSGTRKLRFEVHAVGSGNPARYLMLLRERTLIDGADRAQFMASECEANRQVIASLVHDAKGPLNNLHLTLALLASALARMEASNAPAETLARCHRYVAVMQTEETRLTGCLNDIHALARRVDATPEHIDVGALLRNIAHVLRHEARLHEAKLQLDVAGIRVDVRRSASVAARAVCVLRMPGGSRSTDVGDHASRRCRRRGGARQHRRHARRNPGSPDRCIVPHQRYRGVRLPRRACGRTIVEAAGGDVTLVDDGTTAGFTIRLAGVTAPG